MKKNTVKIIAAMLVVAILVIALSNIAFAGVTFSSVTPGTVILNADDTTGTAGTSYNVVGAILTIVQVIGVGVAIIMLIVLAIKYISAAPGDKAEIKKHAVVYVVGAIVLFAASGILGIIRNFAKMFTENGYT